VGGLESSGNDDREVKILLCTLLDIPETRLVDVEQGVIEMYRALGPERYQQVRIEEG
jgi:Putative restriction endonuclease